MLVFTYAREYIYVCSTQTKLRVCMQISFHTERYTYTYDSVKFQIPTSLLVLEFEGKKNVTFLKYLYW